jgi:hypothetical protein
MMESDPEEFTNQAKNPEYAPAIGNLRKMIEERISDAVSPRD